MVEWKVARAGWAVWWRQAIERQAAAGISEAAALILVVDGQTGVTGADEEVVAWLRRTHPSKPVGCRGSPGPAMQLLCWWRHVGHVPAVTAAPTRTGRRGLPHGQRMRPWQGRRAEVVMGTQVVLAVNKCENVGKADEQAADFWALGLSPIAISAISGTGTGDLMDALVRSLPPPPPMQVCLPPPSAGRHSPPPPACWPGRLPPQALACCRTPWLDPRPLICWGLFGEVVLTAGKGLRRCRLRTWTGRPLPSPLWGGPTWGRAVWSTPSQVLCCSSVPCCALCPT